ncbi:MAG TPA: MBL fold metallo-hydrolase, partial [Actinomycetota bacterium]|nr:MBL fold metallo-hydrolase [Actinomycetota bacterium]
MPAGLSHRRTQIGLLIVLLACLMAMLIPLSNASSQTAFTESTITLRKKFFGAENVDATGAVRPDRVIMSWTSIAGFAMAIDGHVVLLDAYIHKGEDQPNYVPTTIDELVGLQPEALFIGHGHFDHAASAGEIVARTGATLVGSPEHCDQTFRQAQTYAASPVPVSCVEAVARGSAPGSEVRKIFPLGPSVQVTALKHLHSAAEPPDGEHHETSLTTGAVPDPGQLLIHPPGPTFVQNLFPFTNDEGSSILYQFQVGSFNLLWNDTGGPLRSQARHILPLLSGLPSTDVQVGSVLGFNDPTNGMRDIVDYVVALKPKIFFPTHHDFVAEYGM